MALTQVTPDVVHNVQSNITQVGTLSNLTVTGNITSANYNYANGVSITTPISSALLTLTSNAAVQAGIIANLTNYANANVTAYLPTHSGNVGASTLNLSANITFSSTNVPHRIRGDFSTSYTSVSEQNKVFFQSTGATDDTYIRVLGGGSGGGIGGVKLYGSYDPGNTTVLQLDSVPGLQSRIVSYASGTATAVPLRLSAGSTEIILDTTGGVTITGTLAGYAQTSTVIGVNQTWQNVSASRAASTTYTNSTGKPIFISVRWDRDDGTLELTVDGLLIGRTGQTAGPVSYTLTAIVPAGSTYMAATTGSGGTLYWHELR